jgi:hypothetical protein
MSEIDVERLKVDAGYWPDESEAFFYMPEGMFKPFFAKSAKHSDLSTGEMSGGWIGEKLNGDTYHVFSACWERIPRPTKQEWEGGLPTVDCKCQFIHPGIKSHGWQTGVIKAYFDDRVVIQSNPLIWEPNGIAVILIDSELKFRPLKSKQELQREELAGLCDGYIKRDDYGHNLADAILSRYNLEPKP